MNIHPAYSPRPIQPTRPVYIAPIPSFFLFCRLYNMLFCPTTLRATAPRADLSAEAQKSLRHRGVHLAFSSGVFQNAKIQSEIPWVSSSHRGVKRPNELCRCPRRRINSFPCWSIGTYSQNVPTGWLLSASLFHRSRETKTSATAETNATAFERKMSKRSHVHDNACLSHGHSASTHILPHLSPHR